VEPWDTPDAEAAPGEQAMARGASIKTNAEATKRLENDVTSFVVIDIAKR
jgi:hypothetical protein